MANTVEYNRKTNSHHASRKILFDQYELFTILSVAKICHSNEKHRKVAIDDILEFLESVNSDNFEVIDEKNNALSKTRRSLLERRINKLIESKKYYNHGRRKDIDGSVYFDQNVDETILTYFQDFLN